MGGPVKKLAKISMMPLEWAGKALGMGETPGLPPEPAKPPTVDDAAEAQRKADEARKRRGRAATYLTTPRGVASSPVGTKTLVGA